MKRWITKTWLPLLAVALVVALLYDDSSVEKVNLDSSIRTPVASSPAKTETSTRSAFSREDKLTVGQRFNALDELVKNQLEEGFVRTGYFGKHWPATVTEIATGRHRISFVRQNGTRHNYNKFDGYDMKMVRLKAGVNETIVVFRSQHKR